MGNTFGKLFRVTTFGESHGRALGAIIDGCPSLIPLNEKIIQKELDKRRPGKNALTSWLMTNKGYKAAFTSQRSEPDKVKILSGVFEGKTLGTPIALIVENKDARPQDYALLKKINRAGHADLAWFKKFGIRDWRGGGRASGRETVSRVMAGAVAKQALSTLCKKWFKKTPNISAYAIQIGKKTNDALGAINPLDRTNSLGKPDSLGKIIDSFGGIIGITIKNLPAGLGEPVFDKLNTELAHALFSIGSVRGLEIDTGFKSAYIKGSEYIKIAKNEGISGGISTGKNIELRLTIKPPVSILNKKSVQYRHDACLIPRLLPVVESMAAIVILDNLLQFRATKTI